MNPSTPFRVYPSSALRFAQGRLLQQVLGAAALVTGSPESPHLIPAMVQLAMHKGSGVGKWRVLDEEVVDWLAWRLFHLVDFRSLFRGEPSPHPSQGNASPGTPEMDVYHVQAWFA